MESLTDKEFERKLELNLHKYVMRSDNPNDFLVEFIEHAGGYLNLQTIPEYAVKHNMSYNGVKKHRTIKEIFGVKFVIDNE